MISSMGGGGPRLGVSVPQQETNISAFAARNVRSRRSDVQFHACITPTAAVHCRSTAAGGKGARHQ